MLEGAKKMQRRTLLACGSAAILAAPRTIRAETGRTLRFIPDVDLPSVDPVSTTTVTTVLHGNTIYDQLFSLDAGFQPQPQMLAGHRTDANGTLWELTLREGLLFHDDTPVLARDCVASIQRWAQRDAYGSALLARADEITAASDRVIRIRLKRPFAALPEALAQPACLMMPERVAVTDPYKQITDTTGSGPFRFLADERLPGSRVVYARFEKYVPRSEGIASFLAGPRVVHFDRVVWNYVPDASTAAAALAAGEYDWWGDPHIDHYDLLRRYPGLRLELKNRMGYFSALRFNHLHKPFSNVAIRRLVLACVSQQTFMEAFAGAQPELYRTNVGLFTPGTPMANQAGIEALTARTDFDAVKKELAAAGYNGETVVLIAVATVPTLRAQGQVADDLLRHMGFAVDYQELDLAAVIQRRNSKERPEKGGWNVNASATFYLQNVLPPANPMIRNGAAGMPGFPGSPDVPRLEALREDWLNASTVEERESLAAEMQAQVFRDVPYIPLGVWFQPTCFRKDIVDIQPGWPVMHSVRRA
jgi:peptide/nickel transport system substrate-binding protein